jgi:hypothetical protein
MRSGKTLPVVFLSLLIITLLSAQVVRAAEDEYEDEYEEQARVMRISLLKGEVSVRRANQIEWERAKLNLPLVEGDVLATGRASQLEIQIDARNFVRVGPDSVLKVVTLRDEGIALSLSEGTATLRLARFDKDKEYFEIDAPKTTLAAEKRGLYRLDVERDGGVRLTVREDGRARIYSENSGFVLRNDRTARLTYDGQDDGDWELSAAASMDEWDYWNDERDRFLARRLRYEDRERYYDADVWGAEELDAYGDWSYTREYGYLWRPHVTVINNYNDWAPYRYGHWRWCPPYGWTWVADEDWGWAPYHYGRWVFYNNNWCWAPRGYGYNYRRARWRPALVAFVYIPTSFGEQVCWYPLQHGQRDPRSRNWQRNPGRLTPLRSGDIANLRRSNPAYLRAVSTVPAREFGTASLRARPATSDVAQRALTSDPVRGRLPITPADVQRINSPGATGRVNGRDPRANGANGASGGRERLTIIRPAPVMPPRDVPERPTGAASRTPGVPLDSELRRARIFNGREMRPPSTVAGDIDGRTNDEGTGAVMRPARPGRRPVDGNNPDNGITNGDTPPARVRPARPSEPPDNRVGEPEMRERPKERIRQPGIRDGEGSGERRSRPARPLEERPIAPPVYEQPAPRERRHESEERVQPPPGRQEPPSRPERPERREERPPASTEPPPRQEEPRQEPPRQEAPRQEAPRQEAPRQEAPRQEAPRQERPTPSAPARERPSARPRK